jgi:hypothetical protein
MAAQTIHTPKGFKVRTARSTRFVVIVEGDNRAWVEKGSASMATIRVHIQRQRNKGDWTPRQVWDMRDRKFV